MYNIHNHPVSFLLSLETKSFTLFLLFPKSEVPSLLAERKFIVEVSF